MSFRAELIREQPRRPLVVVAVLIFLGAVTALALFIGLGLSHGEKTGSPGARNGDLSLAFEPNEGQADNSAAFVARAGGGLASFSAGEVHMALPGTEIVEDNGLCEAPSRALVPTGLKLRFIGASESVRPSAGEILPGSTNSMLGSDSSQLQTNLPTYESIIYSGLYPGVDLTYSGSDGQLKGTYTVAPGADPFSISWRYIGAEDVSIDAGGNLRVNMNGGVILTEQVPVAWQDINEQRVAVEAHYTMAHNGNISFSLGHYDPAFPIAIEPTLNYSIWEAAPR